MTMLLGQPADAGTFRDWAERTSKRGVLHDGQLVFGAAGHLSDLFREADLVVVGRRTAKHLIPATTTVVDGETVDVAPDGWVVVTVDEVLKGDASTSDIRVMGVQNDSAEQPRILFLQQRDDGRYAPVNPCGAILETGHGHMKLARTGEHVSFDGNAIRHVPVEIGDDDGWDDLARVEVDTNITFPGIRELVLQHTRPPSNKFADLPLMRFEEGIEIVRNASRDANHPQRAEEAQP